MQIKINSAIRIRRTHSPLRALKHFSLDVENKRDQSDFLLRQLYESICYGPPVTMTPCYACLAC